MGGVEYQVNWVYKGISNQMKKESKADIDILMKKIKAMGVTTCCMGAGSRSSQLVHALNQMDIQMIPFIDERVVGYMAIGIIKAVQQPVVVLTTSGTAVSNLCPAMTEAANSHLPLIAVTADRPKHMQGTSANQTINQVGIFQDALFELHWENQAQSFMLDQAFDAMYLRGGPIHINVHLEDPVSEELVQVDVDNGVPCINKPRVFAQCLDKTIETSKQGLICIGQLEPWVDLKMMEALLDHFHWPVVVDGSQARLKRHPNAYHSSDAFCVKHSAQNFDSILYLGGRWVSKRMADFLSAEHVTHYSEGAHPVVHVTKSNQIDYASLLTLKTQPRCIGIKDVNETVNLAIQKSIKNDPCSDLSFMVSALESIDQPFDCFISNSLPIRLFDQMCIQTVRQVHVNRGASGIDGNIATIMGLSMMKTDIPLLAIVGDLASVYDLNAFFLMSRVQRPLCIMVINNGGGDIFSLLPSARKQPNFNDQFKLSHSYRLAPIIEAMGINVTTCKDSRDVGIQFDQHVMECITTGGANALSQLQLLFNQGDSH